MVGGNTRALNPNAGCDKTAARDGYGPPSEPPSEVEEQDDSGGLGLADC